MSVKSTLKSNFEAIKVAVRVEKENRLPTAEEIEIINEFKGWGEIKSILIPIDRNWEDLKNISQQDKLLENDIKEVYFYLQQEFPEKYQQIWESIKNAVLTSFYTPKEVVDKIIEKYQENNKNIQSFLDPSAGMGVYVDSVVKYFPDIQQITAVEKDFLTAFLLKVKYKNNNKINVINEGFEKVDFQQKFDFIASNIPFGDVKISYPKYDNIITDKIHNFFVYHCASLLNEGGAMSIISSTGLMNSQRNQPVRELLANNCEYNPIITLPNNLFKESGTEVSSHIINITKKSVQDESTKKFNKLFVSSLLDENGVNTNEFVYRFKERSFLDTPILGTNQYGNPEYNYTMPISDVLKELNAKLYFKESNIIRDFKEGISEENLIYKNVSTNLLANVVNKYNISSDYNKASLRSIGTIEAKYKGYTIPAATVLKIDNIIDKRKTGVFIIPHIENENFYKSTGLITTEKFKNEWRNFIENLETTAEKHQLEIFLDKQATSKDEFAKFQQFFNGTFKQPELKYLYRNEIQNFEFHKTIEKGMMFLNLEREVWKIDNISSSNIYKIEKVDLSGEEKERFVKGLLEIYHSYNSFISFEKKLQNYIDNTPVIEEKYHTAFERKTEKFMLKLNEDYDNFIKEFGSINDNSSKIQSLDYNLFPILSALEKKVDNHWIKTDVFYSQYHRDNTRRLTPYEAIVKSINTLGKIDENFIEKLTGLDWEEAYKEVDEVIIYNPINVEYELRDVFLSGDIYSKINELKEIGMYYDNGVEKNRWEEQMEELQRVIPEKIPFFKIEKEFGTRWIPIDIIKKFVDENYGGHFDIRYDEKVDYFLVQDNSGYWGNSFKTHQTLGGRYIRAEDIIENAFYDNYPNITYKDSEGNTHIDSDSMRFVRREVTKLKNNFINFLGGLPDEEKEALEKIYNETFNGIVLPKANGDLLDFSEMELSNMNVKDMYPHQKNAIWQMLVNGGGVVDHEVGFGKTLTMCGLANKLKTFNIAKKPIIIGLKANVGDLAETYKKLYPEAKVLYATTKDFEKKNREVFLNKIRNENWDVIVMGHSQFLKIPQDDMVMKKIFQEELKDVEDNLLGIPDGSFSKKQLKGLEQRKKALERKLEEVNERLKTHKDENVLSFTDLGIDHIIIDESHKFKNLGFETRHQRVAGLGQTAHKQGTSNILTAIRTIQQNKNKDFGATFFSGTPISNSLTELYLLQKYLTPKKLEEKGIRNFDAWASNFTRKSVEFETNMVNEVVAKERFRYFVNMPELSLMYSQMAHIMNDRVQKGLVERPEKSEHLINTEQTPLQRKFFKHLADFLKTGKAEKLRLENPINLDDRNQALSLIAMNLSFKASIDMRLINSSFPDEKTSKINTMVRDVVDYYHKFDEQKGTQIIFSDLGTSKKKLSFKEMNDNYNAGIFTSVYDDIKYKLIRAGIPENEIAFAQDYDKPEKKAILNEKMNKGEVRVLIGSTETAGTGLNVQERLISMKHLTIPWKPSEFEQRNGRGYRKGNLIAKNFNNNKVDIGIMTTSKTLDNYKIDLNKNKAIFIDQLRNSTSNQRVIDEGAMDEGNISFAELQAQLTGDNSLLEKSKIDKKIKELEEERKSILYEVGEAKKNIAKNNEIISNLKEVVELQKEDLELFKNNIQFDENGRRINNPTYIGLGDNPTPEEIISHLKKIEMDFRNNVNLGSDRVVVAKMYGFELMAENDFFKGTQWVVRRENDNRRLKLSYNMNGGKINFDNENSTLNYFINTFNYIENRIKSNIKNIDNYQSDNKKLEVRAKNEFTKENLLVEFKEKSLELEEKIKNNNSNKLEFETTVVNINSVEKEVPKVLNTKFLDAGLIEDKLGYEGIPTATLFSPEIVDILKNMSSKNIEIINTKNIDEGKVVMSYTINDSYGLYEEVSNYLKNNNIPISDTISSTESKEQEKSDEIKEDFNNEKKRTTGFRI